MSKLNSVSVLVYTLLIVENYVEYSPILGNIPQIMSKQSISVQLENHGKSLLNIDRSDNEVVSDE